MAFIKRSTVTPVNAKVGRKMLKCSACGKPFVSQSPTTMCQTCTPRITSLDEDHFEEKPDFDLDQE